MRSRNRARRSRRHQVRNKITEVEVPLAQGPCQRSHPKTAPALHFAGTPEAPSVSASCGGCRTTVRRALHQQATRGFGRRSPWCRRKVEKRVRESGRHCVAAVYAPIAERGYSGANCTSESARVRTSPHGGRRVYCRCVLLPKVRVRVASWDVCIAPPDDR